ncbi:hypothetical protein B0H34DRAFT_666363 [Crassisporium funariophilum]|nr:hypothetical protein B0H34DRAFT_666363 [Crassisporium funariophilum]
MAQPSQVFPPWLTPSPSVITNAAGVPVSTSTTIIYLPLTYFGPSIPLGSLFVFGGSTSPATVPTATSIPTTSLTTTATPTFTITTTSATPTTSVSTPAPSTSSIPATPTSTTSLSVTSSSSTTSLTSTSTSFTTTATIPGSSSTSFTSSPTASPTFTPTSVGTLSKGQLVGVIVASILGLIFLFVLALFLYLWCKGRRNRRPLTNSTAIDDDYFFVPEGGHTPGEGSPRHSGEEADPFLQRSNGGGSRLGETSAAGAAMSQLAGEMGTRPRGVSRVPPPTTNSNSSNGSSNSNASGYGVLLDRPSLGLLPSMPEHPHVGGTILSSADMQRLEHESVLPDDPDHYGEGEYTGAYAYYHEPLQPPPRLVNPESFSSPLLFARPPFITQDSYASNRTSFPVDVEESATLLTARRVKAEDLTPRTPPRLHESNEGPSHKASNGLLGAIGMGLGGLANIGRMSWFKNLDSPRHSLTSPSYTGEALSDKDLETGRDMFTPAPQRLIDSFGSRSRAGAARDGSRPRSTVSGLSAHSGTSGGTLYHDATSSLPDTPLLATLPRAVTPAEQPMSEHSWFSSPLAAPPVYDDPFLTSTTPPPPTRTRSPPSAAFDPVPPGTDILDMPAPVALTHFGSISSLKETATGSSVGLKSTPFPPGLYTVKPVGWSEAATEVTPSEASFGVLSGLDNGAGISIDVLEDAPPDAEQGWRRMANSAGMNLGDAGRRGTFGLVRFVHGPGFMSEQGSLHSMRSHFAPSSRSTGSAPASRRDGSGSVGSSSSRPSAHSGFSLAHSLPRTGSISSDGRKRNHGGLISPALSAFGQQLRAPTSGGQGGSRQQRPTTPVQDHNSLSPTIGSPPSAHMSPDKMGSTIRSVGSGSTTLMADSSFGTLRGGGGVYRSGSASPLSANFPLSAPWAGGLDNDWTPAA